MTKDITDRLSDKELDDYMRLKDVDKITILLTRNDLTHEEARVLNGMRKRLLK